jgi:hypothetical protein
LNRDLIAEDGARRGRERKREREIGPERGAKGDAVDKVVQPVAKEIQPADGHDLLRRISVRNTSLEDCDRTKKKKIISYRKEIEKEEYN